jgi:hypothetical protein
MPKSPSDELKELIASLHTGEIVYFKKYARRHCDKEAVYVQLFDKIKETTDCIDENIMKLTGISNKQRFAEHKWYLHQLILDALAVYHKNKRVDFEVRDLITKATILMSKKLFAQALKIVEQAKLIINKSDITYALNEVLSLEATIMLETFSVTDFAGFYKNTFAACRRNAHSIHQLSHLLEIRYLVNSLYFKYGTLATVVDGETLSYCMAQLGRIDRNSLSRFEQIIYDTDTLDLLTFKNDAPGFHQVFVRLKQTYLQHPALVQQHTHNYVYMLYHSIAQFIGYGNKQAAEENLQELQSLPTSNLLFRENYYSTLITCNAFYFEQILLLKQGAVAMAYQQLQDKREKIKQCIGSLPARAQSRNYYLFAIICFYSQQYKEALGWLDKVFDQSAYRLDLQLAARMCEIACHAELGNLLLVTHKLVAINRYNKKQLANLQQVKIFSALIKLLAEDSCLYKTKKKRNHLESQLMEVCRKEAIERFGFDIALYFIMKNNQLNFNDALLYYNCNPVVDDKLLTTPAEKQMQFDFEMA